MENGELKIKNEECGMINEERALRKNRGPFTFYALHLEKYIKKRRKLWTSV